MLVLFADLDSTLPFGASVLWSCSPSTLVVFLIQVRLMYLMVCLLCLLVFPCISFLHITVFIYENKIILLLLNNL